MKNTHKIAPGLHMKARRLTHPVVTCLEAATAKDIPLRHELKTIVLETSKGLYAVHVPGDSKISLRAVKVFLKVKEAYLASLQRLNKMNLYPGTVCPILEPIWSMRHLLSYRVLCFDYIATNNGTFTGYYIFSPKQLLKADCIQIGEFEKNGGPRKQ